jgi:hypothetical protein
MPTVISQASAQSVAERTDGNGNRAKLGLQRSQNYNNGVDTVAPVAAPGKVFNGNRAKLGPARSGIAYEGDVESDARDRTMGYGNRTKLGLPR